MNIRKFLPAMLALTDVATALVRGRQAATA